LEIDSRYLHNLNVKNWVFIGFHSAEKFSCNPFPKTADHKCF